MEHYRLQRLGVTKVAKLNLRQWGILILNQRVVYITGCIITICVNWYIPYVLKCWIKNLILHRSLNIQYAPAVSLSICLSGWWGVEAVPCWFRFSFFVPWPVKVHVYVHVCVSVWLRMCFSTSTRKRQTENMKEEKNCQHCSELSAYWILYDP